MSLTDKANLNRLLADLLVTDDPCALERAVSSEVSQTLVDAIRKSGLAGLMLERARELQVVWPADFTAKLKREATIVAAENLNARHELTRVLHACNEAEVAVLLLKGAALNLTLYARPDQRPMSDVDLLIRADRVEQAFAALERCGCKRGFELLRDDFFPKYHYEVEFHTNSARPLRLDVHVRPLRPLRVARFMPDDALWEGAQRVNVEDAHAFVPAPEAMLVHLCAHAAYHGCSRLLWLYDIHHLVANGPRFDWDRVSALAQAWRLSLPVYEALRCTHLCFGTAVPEALLRQPARREANWADRLVLRQAPRDAANPVRHILVDLLCTPGLGFRLGYLRAVLCPDKGHLGELYKHRHPGWPAVAHAWRFIRSCTRGLQAIRNRLTPRHI